MVEEFSRWISSIVKAMVENTLQILNLLLIGIPTVFVTYLSYRWTKKKDKCREKEEHENFRVYVEDWNVIQEGNDDNDMIFEVSCIIENPSCLDITLKQPLAGLCVYDSFYDGKARDFAYRADSNIDKVMLFIQYRRWKKLGKPYLTPYDKTLYLKKIMHEKTIVKDIDNCFPVRIEKNGANKVCFQIKIDVDVWRRIQKEMSELSIGALKVVFKDIQDRSQSVECYFLLSQTYQKYKERCIACEREFSLRRCFDVHCQKKIHDEEMEHTDFEVNKIEENELPDSLRRNVLLGVRETIRLDSIKTIRIN